MPFRLVNCILPTQHRLNYLIISLTIERRVTTEEDVEDDTAAPKIAFVIVVPFEDLWSNVVRGSIFLCQLLTVDIFSRRAKVDDCHARLIARFVEKEVFWFEISMDDILTMAVVDR